MIDDLWQKSHFYLFSTVMLWVLHVVAWQKLRFFYVATNKKKFLLRAKREREKKKKKLDKKRKFGIREKNGEKMRFRSGEEFINAYRV